MFVHYTQQRQADREKIHSETRGNHAKEQRKTVERKAHREWY